MIVETLRRPVDPASLVAAEGAFVVVARDDVLARLGAEGLQQVAQVADDREGAQHGVGSLHQVVDHDQGDQPAGDAWPS